MNLELLSKTQTYWRISQARSNRSDEDIPMGDALNELTRSIYNSNPSRPLVFHMVRLREELIHDIGPRIYEATANVTPLHKQA